MSRDKAGTVKMDTLLINEGFGTLGASVLEKTIEALREFSSGDRLVGIVSHVGKLDESIQQKLRVTCDEKGSHVRQGLS